jgi:hypothetical protein
VHAEEKTRVAGVCGGDDAGVVAVGGDLVGVLGVVEYGGLAGALVGEVHAEEMGHRLESAQVWSNWKSAAGSLRWVHRVVPPRVRLGIPLAGQQADVDPRVVAVHADVAEGGALLGVLAGVVAGAVEEAEAAG